MVCIAVLTRTLFHVGSDSMMKIQAFTFILVTTIFNAVDSGRNLALRKPANASSTYTGSYQIWASNVVDGSPSGDFNDRTCHSGENGDLNPWWQVDLQAVYRISRVQIVGRSDGRTEWLHDFYIEMYDGNPTVTVGVQPKLCHFYKGVFKPTTQDIKCDSVVSGRILDAPNIKTTSVAGMKVRGPRMQN
ncbi:fucolectin-like [Haliotis rubra]|uniref:fucolectin-like n=1 Tax=Haliotis rubra TaxID=36100 RepID=UPI001EE5C607|nr:fucolectin-like [Haliotis rubra]